MAKVPIRKPKRATLLTKRSVCLGKKFREKSHKLLYENVKKNNSYLAKALSHEKQNNQNLFKQNLSLFAEIQNLNLTCTKQTSIITSIQNNAKEMLKMLVTMSSFLTNTLTMCQEFVTSNNNARLSSVSTGRKESSKKSPKSPAKGVVKPMVSGHTITKPTINLSRINTENITNISRLSIVQEVLTPERNEENENRSSITTPFATSPLRYENNRRMPERMRISSPRVSDAETVNNEQRKQKRSRHSRRMGSYTRLESERWSVDETPRHSRDRISIGSPRVKLRDVSKLLQDSRTINIRRLIGSRIDDVEIQESSNDVSQDTLERNVITETEMSVNVNEENESYLQTPKTDSDAKTRKVSEKEAFNETLYTAGSSRKNNSRDWEDDPLEGPSWLFSNTLNMPSPDNEPEELDRSHNFDVNNNSEIAYAESSDTDSIEDQSRNSVESVNVSNTSSTGSVNASVINHAGCESSSMDDNNTDNNICETMSTIFDRERVNDAHDSTSFESFITYRRGHSEVVEEEEDDFTLMLTCPSPQNFALISDLQLPDEDNVTDSARENGIDNASLMNIPSVLNETEHAQIKQPLILVNNDEITSNKKKQQIKNNKNKKSKTSKVKDETDQSENGPRLTKKAKQKISLESNRDPSAAKVVLEKLNESHIKPRVSSDDDMEFRRINDYTTDMDNHGDSQSLDSENQRPKRRNTPITLKEPSLRKKLRRD